MGTFEIFNPEPAAPAPAPDGFFADVATVHATLKSLTAPGPTSGVGTVAATLKSFTAGPTSGVGTVAATLKSFTAGPTSGVGTVAATLKSLTRTAATTSFSTVVT